MRQKDKRATSSNRIIRSPTKNSSGSKAGLRRKTIFVHHMVSDQFVFEKDVSKRDIELIHKSALKTETQIWCYWKSFSGKQLRIQFHPIAI